MRPRSERETTPSTLLTHSQVTSCHFTSRHLTSPPGQIFNKLCSASFQGVRVVRLEDFLPYFSASLKAKMAYLVFNRTSVPYPSHLITRFCFV